MSLSLNVPVAFVTVEHKDLSESAGPDEVAMHPQHRAVEARVDRRFPCRFAVLLELSIIGTMTRLPLVNRYHRACRHMDEYDGLGKERVALRAAYELWLKAKTDEEVQEIEPTFIELLDRILP